MSPWGRLSKNQTGIPDKSNYETSWKTHFSSIDEKMNIPWMLFIAFMIRENTATRIIHGRRWKTKCLKKEKLLRLQSFYSLDRYITFYTFYHLIYINFKFILSLYKDETLSPYRQTHFKFLIPFEINLKTSNLNQAPYLASTDAQN